MIMTDSMAYGQQWGRQLAERVMAKIKAQEQAAQDDADQQGPEDDEDAIPEARPVE